MGVIYTMSSDYVPRERVHLCHYDPTDAVIVEPLKCLQLTSSSENPGGDHTRWINSADGDIYYGDNPVAGGDTGGVLTDTLFIGDAPFTPVGATGADIPITILLKRVGDVVTCTIESDHTTKVAATHYQSVAGLIPAEGRGTGSPNTLFPAIKSTGPVVYDDLSGMVTILSGLVSIHRTTDHSANWDDSATSGWEDITFSWIIFNL